MSAALKGGDKLAAKLAQVAENFRKATEVRMGFLEDATYPDGTPVAYIAAINEWGATINAQARTQIIYRKSRRLRKGKKGNQFVKASAKNAVAKEVDVGAHTIIIPARPFFRSMIAQNQDSWGPELAKILKANNFDAEKGLKLLGQMMGEQLQESIRAFADPPNAKSTIAKKGFNQPLIDDGHMLNSVDSEVS